MRPPECQGAHHTSVTPASLASLRAPEVDTKQPLSSGGYVLYSLQRNVIRNPDTVRNGYIFIIYFVFGKISLKRIEIRIQ